MKYIIKVFLLFAIMLSCTMFNSFSMKEELKEGANFNVSIFLFDGSVKPFHKLDLICEEFVIAVAQQPSAAIITTGAVLGSFLLGRRLVHKDKKIESAYLELVQLYKTNIEIPQSEREKEPTKLYEKIKKFSELLPTEEQNAIVDSFSKKQYEKKKIEKCIENLVEQSYLFSNISFGDDYIVFESRKEGSDLFLLLSRKYLQHCDVDFDEFEKYKRKLGFDFDSLKEVPLDSLYQRLEQEQWNIATSVDVEALKSFFDIETEVNEHGPWNIYLNGHGSFSEGLKKIVEDEIRREKRRFKEDWIEPGCINELKKIKTMDLQKQEGEIQKFVIENLVSKGEEGQIQELIDNVKVLVGLDYLPPSYKNQEDMWIKFNHVSLKYGRNKSSLFKVLHELANELFKHKDVKVQGILNRYINEYLTPRINEIFAMMSLQLEEYYDEFGKPIPQKTGWDFDRIRREMWLYQESDLLTDKRNVLRLLRRTKMDPKATVAGLPIEDFREFLSFYEKILRRIVGGKRGVVICNSCYASGYNLLSASLNVVGRIKGFSGVDPLSFDFITFATTDLPVTIQGGVLSALSVERKYPFFRKNIIPEALQKYTVNFDYDGFWESLNAGDSWKKVLNFVVSGHTLIRGSKEYWAANTPLIRYAGTRIFQPIPLVDSVKALTHTVTKARELENKKIVVRSKEKVLLLYPQIIRVPFEVKDFMPKVVSMHPAPSMHYFKEIVDSKSSLVRIVSSFVVTKIPKFFVVKRLICSDGIFENVMIQLKDSILSKGSVLYRKDEEFFVGKCEEFHQRFKLKKDKEIKSETEFKNEQERMLGEFLDSEAQYAKFEQKLERTETDIFVELIAPWQVATDKFVDYVRYHLIATTPEEKDAIEKKISVLLDEDEKVGSFKGVPERRERQLEGTEPKFPLISVERLIALDVKNIKLLEVLALLTKSPEEDFIPQDQVAKAIKILQIKADKFPKVQRAFNVFNSLSSQKQKEMILEVLPVLQGGEEVIDLINKLDLSETVDQDALLTFAKKIMGPLQVLFEVPQNAASVQEKNFLRDELLITTPQEFIKNLKPRTDNKTIKPISERDLNYRLDTETFRVAYLGGWKDQQKGLKDKLDKMPSLLAGFPSRYEIFTKTESIENEESKKQFRYLWAEVVWSRYLGLSREIIKK